MELGLPRMVKKVQSLNGKIATLNRFISKATDKCLPFFRILRKSFEWTDECQKARGQKDLDNGASTRTDHQISTREVSMCLYKHLKGIKSNA